MMVTPPPPSSTPRGLAAWALDRAVTGAPGSWLTRWARRHVLARPALRAEYDALRAAGRALSGAAFAPEQRDLVADLLRAPTPAPRRVFAGVGALAAGAASVALFFFVGTDGNQPRSGAEPALGVKVQCLTGADAGWRVHDAAVAGLSDPLERLSCPTGATYSFALTNLREAAMHVFVLGVDSDGVLHWFAPFTRESGSVLAESGSVERLLGTVADTAGQSLPPDVTLFVLFSSTPISGRAIERDLAASRGLELGRLDRLPVDVEHQARIQLSPDRRGGP